MSHKKSKFILFLVLLCGMITFSGCWKANISIEPSSVSKIKIASGLTGDEYTIEDSTQIGEITDMANDLHLGVGNKDNSKGYVYNIDFLDNKDSIIESFLVVDKNHINKDGYSYRRDCNKIIEYIDEIANGE